MKTSWVLTDVERKAKGPESRNHRRSTGWGFLVKTYKT